MKNVIVYIAVFFCFSLNAQVKDSGSVEVLFAWEDYWNQCVTVFKDKSENEYKFYDADLSDFANEHNCGIAEMYMDSKFQLEYETKLIKVFGEDENGNAVEQEIEGLVIKYLWPIEEEMPGPSDE